MTSSFLKSLLRRTAAIGVTVAPFFFSAPASALTVILNNTTGNSCTYSGMAVDPAGNVTVTCQGSTTTTGPGTFSVSASTTMAAPASGATSLWNTTVLRTGGTAGTATVDYAAAGTACASAGQTLNFADGGTLSTQSLGVPVTITGAGTCTITLSNATTATLSTTSFAVTVNVTASTGGTGSNGVPIVAGCASPDPTTTMSQLPVFNGNPLYPLKLSGEVTSYPLPRLPAGKNVQWVAFGETPQAYTPSPYSADVSFSTCPGVFAPKASAYDYCNWAGITQKNGFTVKWSETSTYSRFYGSCLADPSTQYYMNVRWTYTSCSQGAPACGFSLSTGG